ncbi:unnamed protein product [Aphanomyces euteiches]|uniref:NADH:flavin oxidoreductase/NADH oxidase N-terminal domain-containing protein n=1 Tax=Aphanomyces euteiches TaxID=100861 RepID=A0A6G0XEE1_9STRA|nr:hypothetical protein Ae201684_005538 [Aphanomyces euteiches]KAH9078783.1 hypothetical protein Ae201684P_019857 [Aphanomyces euteiches]
MANNLFSPIQIGSLHLKNRIFMAPLSRYRAEISTEIPTDLMVEYYAQRASAGLIFAGAAVIAPKTLNGASQPGIYTEEQLAGWKKVTDAVHAKGGKIFAQLWHPGRAAQPDLNDGTKSVAPSAIAIERETHRMDGPKAYTPQHEAVSSVRPEDTSLTADEIATLVQQYATAAKNAVEVAGFDGVEIHAANGHLIDQFLSSSSNIRTDNYGGSLENRARFATEVVQVVTKAIGSDKVGIRFSPLGSFNSINDDDPEGISEYVARLSQRFNLAYVHVVRRDFFGVRQGDIVPIFRQHFTNTLVSNLGFTKDEANAEIEAGNIDAVSFGQLFIANPDLVERFAKDAELNTPDRSTFYTGGAKGYTDYPKLAQA